MLAGRPGRASGVDVYAATAGDHDDVAAAVPFEPCPRHGATCLMRCSTCEVAICRQCTQRGDGVRHVGKAHALRSLVRGSDAPLSAGSWSSVTAAHGAAVTTTHASSSPLAGPGSPVPSAPDDGSSLAPGLRSFLGPWFGHGLDDDADAASVATGAGGPPSESSTLEGATGDSSELRHDLGFDASSSRSDASSDASSVDRSGSGAD